MVSGDEPGVRIRTAAPAEGLEVRRILDAAMLEFDGLDARLEAGDVLVATAERPGGEAIGGSRERVLGALILEPRAKGAVVEAVAVRRRRRARGIGTRLVAGALEREGRLRARFDEGVRPFYESLGFEIREVGDGRYEGERRLADGPLE